MNWWIDEVSQFNRNDQYLSLSLLLRGKLNYSSHQTLNGFR